MSSSDRPDALAPAETDDPEALAEVPDSGTGSDPERSGGTPPSTVPVAIQDDSGPVSIEPRKANELLEPQRNGEGIEPRGSAQLVSGDPLLLGPTSPVRSSAPPQPPKPPPPPANQPAVRPVASEVAGQPTGPSTIVPGVSVAPAGQPVRRAARGAHVTAPRPAVPPTRPPEQPVATLRPTTVAPVPRLAGRRPRVRRVTRVVRHVDPWSVFKVAAAFSVVAYAIALVSGVLLWNVAYATGTIDNIERGMESTGWEVFELDGGEIFHNAWIGGLFGAVAMTGLAVLVATLFNLITDLVGGIRLTVLEEEVVEKTASPMRRFATSPARRAPASAQDTTGPQGADARVRRARGG